MRGRWMFRGVKFVVFAVLIAAALSFVVMGLWKWLMPALFALHRISFWQALGVLLLSKILFGGFRGRRCGGPMQWKGRVMQRWAEMTPEEREKMREGMNIRLRDVWNARGGAKGLGHARELRRSDRNRGFGKAYGGDRGQPGNPAGGNCERHARPETQALLRNRTGSNRLLRLLFTIQRQGLSSCHLEKLLAAVDAVDRWRGRCKQLRFAQFPLIASCRERPDECANAEFRYRRTNVSRLEDLHPNPIFPRCLRSAVAHSSSQTNSPLQHFYLDFSSQSRTIRKN